MHFRKVLVTADKDPVAVHALDLGLDLAQALGAEAALIHVFEPLASYGADSGMPPDELKELARQEGRRLLAGIRERRSLSPAIQEFLLGGNPAAEIARAAREWPADMIIIGSHGRTGMSRVVLGSVAEAVVRTAPCPVLVVRAKE